MRPCVLLTPVEYGGGERRILFLAEEFRKLGAEARLILLAKSAAFEEEACKRNITFLRVSSAVLGFSPTIFSYCWHLVKIFPFVFFNRRLQAEVLAADVLWARGFPANAFAVIALAVYRSKRPKMVYSHHSEKRPAKGFMRWIQLKMLERFDVVVGVSASVADTLRSVFPELADNIIAIPNGIDTGKFEMRNSKLEMRRELDLPLDAVIAVYAARFTPPKNHIFLLEVLQRCGNPALRLMLLGDGSERKPFMDRARQENLSDRIIHRGFVRPDEVSRYLAASDFCIFPSLGEGFSNAVLEAMAAGLPVVMFKRIWSEEYGKNVIVVQTPEEFIAAVGRLAADPNVAAELGRRCRLDAQMLDIQNIARRYLELFSKI